jgi:predicted HTH domain antitoxin
LKKAHKMKTIQLNIPDTVDLNDREAKMLLASRLYEKGKLSLGQAAELAGLSKRTFMEILGDYSVSIFNYPISELENDIKNARNYSI